MEKKTRKVQKLKSGVTLITIPKKWHAELGDVEVYEITKIGEQLIFNPLR